MSYEVAQPQNQLSKVYSGKRRVSPAKFLNEVGYFYIAKCYDYFMYYAYILQLINKTYYHGFSEALKFEAYLKTNSGFAFRNKRLV